MADSTKFSVIVPVYNGEETLDHCLTALVEQDYPKNLYEIIVVDDGSTDSTAEIAAKYPVKLITLSGNQGRIIARNTGAKTAKFDTLVFNDVRVTAENKLLTKLNHRNYQPLMPQVEVYNGSRWGFDRFFHLLRWRLYGDYYHSAKPGIQDYWIDKDNFDHRPKGTTLFVCNKQLWSSCQPHRADKDVNDDTRILREIVKHRPILKAGEIKVVYKHRTAIMDVIPHIFERGPRFADYYLRSRGRYRSLYIGIWFIITAAALIMMFYPVLVLSSIIFLILTLLLTASFLLSRTWSDFLVIGGCLLIVASAFGLGILKWQLVEFFLVKDAHIKETKNSV